MSRINNAVCEMRDTPFSDVELARFRRLLDNPKPGNPRWYKMPTVTPFVFRPGAAPAVPRQARCTVMTVPLHAEIRCIGGPFAGAALAVCIENDVGTLPMTYQGKIGRYEGTKPGGAPFYTGMLQWIVLKEAATMDQMRGEGPAILWTRPKLVKFKQAYQDAIDTCEGEFIFEGNEFMMGYAKYLIEFLDGKFK